MAADNNDKFMYETITPSMVLHQMRNHVLSNVTQPSLNVHITRKNVKVPQVKSKKLEQLQSKPIDPNASLSLLMIAPLSDSRYRTWVKESSVSAPIEALRHREYPRYQTNKLVTQTPPTLLDDQILLGSKTDPGYFRQLSAFAAMTWTKNSQANDKLRQMYENTSLRSHDPFSMMTPYSSPYVTSSKVLSEIQKSQEFPRSNPQDIAGKTQLMFQQDPSGYVEYPYMCCACARCKLIRTKNINMTSQAMNGLKSKEMTSQTDTRVPQFDNLLTRQFIVPNNEMKRLKRVSSSAELSQQPPNKMFKEGRHVATKQPYRDQSSSKGALLSYLRTKNKINSLNSNFPSNDLLPSVLQFNASSIYQCDPPVTSSYENHYFSNSQMIPGNTAVRVFNGFNNYFQPQIVSALK